MLKRFLLLSDIHFRREIAGSKYELDADLRRELVSDVRRLTTEIGPLYGVLVNGDIAFRGAAEEYEVARRWLYDVCEAAGCPAQRVWTVPGNHDVDRSVIAADRMLQAARREMRTCPVGEIDDVIAGWSSSPQYRDKLYEPIAAYNEFAGVYECAISADNPVWTSPIELNDGSTLILLGLNSTLCCDGADSKSSDARKVVLGRHQVLQTPRDPGVVYLALCHHPTSWLRDEDMVEWLMNDRHQIRVFGHEHSARPYRLGDSWVVRAGAVHPERGSDGWRPTYHILSVGVEGEGEGRELLIELRTRVWHHDHYFVADQERGGESALMRRLELPNWHPSASQPSEPTGSGLVHDRTGPALTPTGAAIMDAKRRLVHHFLTLAHPDRMAIAIDLELLCDEDDGVRDRDLVGRLFERAARSNRLRDLWDAVERLHPDGTPDPNPFP